MDCYGFPSFVIVISQNLNLKYWKKVLAAPGPGCSFGCLFFFVVFSKPNFEPGSKE
jgi:hypothetical protein